jgi:hypothetical protein
MTSANEWKSHDEMWNALHLMLHLVILLSSNQVFVCKFQPSFSAFCDKSIEGGIMGKSREKCLKTSLSTGSSLFWLYDLLLLKLCASLSSALVGMMQVQ